jgi:Domain of unknown function (DUF4357)
MSISKAFTLRIFVVDGDPDGLRVIDRTNWNGKALVFPRTLLPTVKQRSEFGQTGVYFLIGPRPDGEGDMLYVGEGDPVRPRFESHYAKKDFWTRGVFFVSTDGQLNKAHVQFLESGLIQLARAAKRMPLDNGNSPAEPALSESDRSYVEVFLDHMLEILPVLGVHAFEMVTAVVSSAAQVPLTCKGKGVTAHGYESTQGFIVKAGSEAVTEEVPSMKEYVRGSYDLRQDLKKSGVLAASGNRLVFTQDYPFSSPSTAADVVLGGSVNGRTVWKDAKGRSLKTLQEKEASAV